MERAAKALGYELKRIPYEQWRSHIYDIARETPDHVLFPLLPLFTQHAAERSADDSLTLRDRYDCRRTLALLADGECVCATLDDQLLHLYLAQLVGEETSGKSRSSEQTRSVISDHVENIYECLLRKICG